MKLIVFPLPQMHRISRDLLVDNFFENGHHLYIHFYKITE